jgi:hypothetical protein
MIRPVASRAIWMLACDSCGETYRLGYPEIRLTRESAECNGWKVKLFSGQRDICPQCKPSSDDKPTHTPVNSGEETKKL